VKALLRFMPEAIGAGSLGVALGVAGHHVSTWQWWLLFGAAIVWRNLPKPQP